MSNVHILEEKLFFKRMCVCLLDCPLFPNLLEMWLPTHILMLFNFLFETNFFSIFFVMIHSCQSSKTLLFQHYKYCNKTCCTKKKFSGYGFRRKNFRWINSYCQNIHIYRYISQKGSFSISWLPLILYPYSEFIFGFYGKFYAGYRVLKIFFRTF